MKKMIRTIALLFTAVTITASANAQEGPKPVASPAQTVTGKLGKANVTIKYGAPSVKGRKIWGGLEPYGKVWRAGANNATTIETDADLNIGGKTLPAGKYSFFLIPAENGDWTAIFNKKAEQWGAYEYKEADDQLRVQVKPVALKAKQEQLTYKINGSNFALEWDMVSVPVAAK